MAESFTIRVPGLQKSVKALAKVDSGFRKEAAAVVKVAAVKIKAEAFAKSKTSPGVLRAGYPLSKGAYTHRATATKGSVGINRQSSRGRNAAVFGAEFGAKQQLVPRGRSGGMKSISQNRMRRRTFPIWRGNSTNIVGKKGPGWIMLPILRKRVPEMHEELDKELGDLVSRTLKKATRNGGF